jgi:hypothetical protein
LTSASGLQCPGCGHVHRLDELGSVETFRCQGCRKLLSVPAVALASGSGGAAATRHGGILSARDAGPDGPSTGPVLAGNGNGGSAPAVAPRRPEPAEGELARPGPSPTRPPSPAAHPVPAVVRMLVWLVALPAGFAAAAVLLRAAGLLDLDHAIDFFAGGSLGRFAILLVLLPLWAALAATLAHFTLEALARRRSRQRGS